MESKQQCTCLIQATGERCPQFGERETGFDFFVCDGHMDELERELEALAPEHKHANN